MTTASPVSYCALTTLAGTRFETIGLRRIGALLRTYALQRHSQTERLPYKTTAWKDHGGDQTPLQQKRRTGASCHCLAEDLNKALELISDGSALCFSAIEMVKEREVILMRYVLYKDRPWI